MTFSIVGRCARTQMLGVAITTSSICVGSRCPWAEAGAGAVATQNVTDPALGRRALALLGEGRSAGETLERLLDGYRHAAYRQLLIVDRNGGTAHHSGEKALGTNAVATGQDCVAGGNLLAGAGVPAAMVDAFRAGAAEHLAERLLRSLEAGLAAGGEAGPVKSAALLVVHDRSWPLVDLRIDWHEDGPVAALRGLWQAYRPQMQDYVTRALDPEAAPSFAVPGDP